MYVYPIFAIFWNKMFIKFLPSPPEYGDINELQNHKINKNKFFIEDVYISLKHITGDDNYEHPNSKSLLIYLII